MWKPAESLDDHSVNTYREGTSKPPRPVQLWHTGQVEILEPLTKIGVPAKAASTAASAFRRTAPHQPLWFRGFIAVGSGALVLIGLVLLSAILIGIRDPAEGPDYATKLEPDASPMETGDPVNFDISSPSSFPPVSSGARKVRSNFRRRPARPSIRLANYKPRRQSRPALEFAEPKFEPTTLIIYSENGLIKSRIEPWLRSS